MRNLDVPPAAPLRPARARSGPRAAVAAAGLLCLGVLAACSGSGEADNAAPSTSSTTAAERTTTTTDTDGTPTTTDDGDFITEEDCVDTEVVADLVGAPVERTLSFGGWGGEVSYSYEGCSYDIGDTDAEVGIVRISGDGLDGPELYDALEAAAAAESDEDGFEQIDDLGDEAYRDGRRLVVLHGPHVLLLAYTPTGDSDDRNPDKALRMAMAVLPLDVSGNPLDCEMFATALEDEFGPVADTMPGSGFDGVNDVSLEYQNCTVEFDDGGEADVGVADATPFAAWVEGKSDSLFSATFEATSVGELRAFDNGDELFVDEGEQPLLVKTDEVDLTDDEAAALRLSLAEVALGS